MSGWDYAALSGDRHGLLGSAGSMRWPRVLGLAALVLVGGAGWTIARAMSSFAHAPGGESSARANQFSAAAKFPGPAQFMSPQHADLSPLVGAVANPPRRGPALLLDCDGTIVDTEKDGHRVAFNRAFVQLLRPLAGAAAVSDELWGVELYGELLAVGGGKERMTKYFTAYAPDLWRLLDATSPAAPSHPLIQQLHKTKTQLFMQIIKEGGLPLRPGIQALVTAAIKAQWVVAICSTSNEQSVHAVNQQLLGGAIEHIYAGDMVAAKKPDPAIYLLAAKELHLDPAQTVVLEDSAIGCRAGAAAGMAVVVTKSTYTTHEHFDDAALVLDDAAGLTLARLQGLLLGCA
eukprot:g22823.t1